MDFLSVAFVLVSSPDTAHGSTINTNMSRVFQNSLIESLSRLAPLALPRRVLQSVRKKVKVSGAEQEKFRGVRVIHFQISASAAS